LEHGKGVALPYYEPHDGKPANWHWFAVNRRAFAGREQVSAL
jgi:hypothetical protein